ncbi:MAG: hypothetical protein ABIK28_03530 [Planctomycetota bacterium]
MKIKMKQSKQGSPNGIAVMMYSANKEYDIPEDLALSFLRQGLAESVKPMPAAPNDTLEGDPDGDKEPKKKDPKGAPENKARKGAPENK